MALVVAFTGVGMTLVGLRWILLRGLHIHYEMFNVQILKLIRAGNVERAVKLCGAVPRCSYALALQAALAAGQKRQGRYGPEIQAAAQAAFQREMDAQLGKLKVPAVLGGLGLVLLLCAAGYALANQLPVPGFSYGVMGAGVLAYLISLYVPAGVKRSTDLFPEVAVALAHTLERHREDG